MSFSLYSCLSSKVHSSWVRTCASIEDFLNEKMLICGAIVVQCTSLVIVTTERPRFHEKDFTVFWFEERRQILIA